MTKIPRAVALGALVAAAFAASTALAVRSPKAAFEARLPKAAPHKLSDLYRVVGDAVRRGLGADAKVSSVRILGQSWEILRDARFPEVELSLKPFEAQGLRFDKAGFLFRRIDVDKEALWHWGLKVVRVREVQSRLVFTLQSLARRLGQVDGVEPRIEADMDDQQVVLSGPGKFCGIPCAVESRCRFVWDEASRTLRLVPVEQRFGGHLVPPWLWGCADGPAPKAPVLDLGFSWIPFNIQEVHVGWDEIDLSTDW